MVSQNEAEYRLYTYWRSSASYRVRIALHLKSIPFESVFVNLKDGAHLENAFEAINPARAVPVLEDIKTGAMFTQSMAMLEYLETAHEGYALLPSSPTKAAMVRGFAQSIVSDIHPIQNLRVLKYLKKEAAFTQDQVKQWAKHWIAEGLCPLENLAKARRAAFVSGDAPGFAECALIPQLYNARRFGVDVSRFENLATVEALCMALPAFQAAAPEQQDDATPA